MLSGKFVQAGFFLAIFISVISSLILVSYYVPSKMFRPNTRFTSGIQLYEQFENLIQDHEAPIIGILTQGTTDMSYYENYTMIVASYIRYIEAAGGRVVAIPYYLNTSDFERIYQNINGLLIPGGRMKLIFPRNQTEGSDEKFKMSKFAKAAKFFVDRAVKDYDEGIYFPIFGICLGQEAIALALNLDLENTITKLDLENNTYLASAGPIFQDVRKSYRSRLFKSFTEEELDAFEDVSKFFYHHKHGISYESFKKSKTLSDLMLPLTANKQLDGTQYITSYEMYDYPFFGVQFHPEKTSFEWNITTDRSFMATTIAHKLGANFIQECRKNSHTVVDPYLVENLRVYNHMVMGPKHNYDQLFYFSKEKMQEILDFGSQRESLNDPKEPLQSDNGRR